MDGSGRSFPKSNRILRSTDFRRVYDQGFRVVTPMFTAFCLEEPGRETGPRIGFTTPRALGKSTKRNRIKRRTREAIRQVLQEIGPQWDVVVNPRRTALEAPFATVEGEVRKLVKRCKPC